MPSLCFDMTSSQPLRLHVDRGLERHGYPWVPTDQVPGAPCQVDPTSLSSADLQVGPETLSTISVTLEDLGRPYPDSRKPAGLVAQASPLDHGGGTVGPETLSTILVTLEDLGRPYPDYGRPAGLVAQASPLDHGGCAARRSKDRGILSVITEGDLPSL
jgi:hypothetical protein